MSSVFAHLFGHSFNRCHERICVGEHLILDAQGMQPMQRFRHWPRHERAHERLCKSAIEREVDLGNSRCRREAAFIGSVIAAERANVIEGPHLAAHYPIACNQIRAGGGVRLGFKHRLVKTWRQRIDQVDIVGELAVLLLGYGAGDEDTEVTDLVVDGVDDGLPVGADLIDVVVEIEDPVERLLGRGDVVALRAEHHNGGLDVAQVDRSAVRTS